MLFTAGVGGRQKIFKMGDVRNVCLLPGRSQGKKIQNIIQVSFASDVLTLKALVRVLLFLFQQRFH